MRLYLSLIIAACMLNTKLNKLQMRGSQSSKVRVQALFHRLQINKNIRFQTRILWKRHQQKSETRLVNHEHGYSIFDESLTLEFTLQFNESKRCYEDKNTEVVAVIEHEGKIKSGGYAKYNIAQVINNSLEGKLVTIPLSQCPDPNANVEVTFTYTLLQQDGESVSSVLNASSRDLNMSRVDFHDDKISLEMDRINATIGKLDELAQTIRTKEKSDRVPELLRRVQELEGENQTLKGNFTRLQTQMASKEKEMGEKAKQDQKTISDLEKQLQRKDRDSKSRGFAEQEEEKRLREEVGTRERECVRYKQQLEELQTELQTLKRNGLRASLTGFGKMEVGDVHQIAEFEAGNEQKEEVKAELGELRSENVALQGNVASMSYKLAQLFNAAYDYGGAKLLDYLQTAIGLTET